MPLCPSCGEDNPAKFRLCGYCGAPLTAAPVHEVRKTVTVVFSDLKGSTDLGEQLDSEALREVMAAYFDLFRVVLEGHGGTVEKFIGDAVMAVFGLPRLHEDDALRAVRAAVEMRAELAGLNERLEQQWGVRLSNRTGVNTGEVVAGDPAAGQRLVTGDTVNVAARLEQAAPVNDILIGESTYELVRDAVRVQPVEPLSLKGKSELVSAFRLIDVEVDVLGQARRVDTPMVGRQRELDQLRERLASATDAGRCELVTIVGTAGVGKSRLIHEFLETIPNDAPVLRCHCLSYGEGITFWALRAALFEAVGATPLEPKNVTRAKLAQLLGAGDADVADRLAAVMGLTDNSFSLQETFWATRRFLETAAATAPVVLVIDDIHWAEPTFLDLIEHLVDNVAAPLLMLCPTRHDLLEERPEWAADRPNATLVALEPLTAAEGEAVVANLLGEVGVPAVVQDRLAETAQGNPLYVEQFLSMLIDGGRLRAADGRWEIVGDLSDLEIPPTISALLSARLDQLRHDERMAIDRASVIGHTFYDGAIRALTPEATDEAIPQALDALTDRELIAPGESKFVGQHAYGFRHILIRDSAYAGLLKRARAELHEQYVGWLERLTGDRLSEYEEIVGYHLEQASLNRRDLGPDDNAGRALAARASDTLTSAGRDALARRDMPAASNLLKRAAAIREPDDPARLALLPDLGEALIDMGEFAKADTYLEELLGTSSESDDERLRAEALVVRMLGRYSTEPEGWAEEVVGVAEDAIAVLERHGDHAALSKAWRLIALVHGLNCHYADAEDAHHRAVDEARLGGDRRQELINLPFYALAAAYGPTPVPRAIARCDEILRECAGSKSAEALVMCALAHLHGLAGDFDAGRAFAGQSRATYDELGLPLHAALVSLDSAPIDLLAEDPGPAERDLRADFDTLSRLGGKNYLATTAALLAGVLHDLGRDDEAEHFAQVSEETSFPGDINSEIEWRCVRARILSARGEHAAAELLVREAVEHAEQTDFLEMQGNAARDCAEVLASAGRLADAAAEAERAMDLFGQKGSTSATALARRQFAALGITLRDRV